MKICSKCGVEKDESEFHKSPATSDGLFRWCKSCRKKYDHERNQRPEVKAAKKINSPVPGTRIICRYCWVEKDESEFDLSQSNLTGRSYQCKECRAKYHRARLVKQKPKAKRKEEIKKQSHEETAEKRRISQRIYRVANKEAVNFRARTKNKERRKTDPDFAIRTQLTNRLGDAVRNGQKAGSGIKDLGCAIPELRAHLESKFQPGMTWENRGHGFGKWNIDHIIPLAAFDLTNRQHVVLACHYLNLQPLWHEDNMKKGDTYPTFDEQCG